VDDLLRLKRAERPPAEFWERFEQELRQKQLAALVERRSWWHAGIAAFGRHRWMRLPIGATAVLVVTLVSVRHYSSSNRYREEPIDVAVRAKSVLAVQAPAISAELRRPDAVVRPAAALHAVMAGAEAPTKRPDVNLAATNASWPAPQQIAELVQRVAGLDGAVASSEPKPLGGSLAIQFGSPGDADLALVDAVHPVGFEDRSISTLRPRHVAEALPTAVAVTEQRRSHLLAALGSAGVYAPEAVAPERATRSVIRYLAEDGWDRSMSRLQAEADHLSIRF
jgi:hypothetical protein